MSRSRLLESFSDPRVRRAVAAGAGTIAALAPALADAATRLAEAHGSFIRMGLLGAAGVVPLARVFCQRAGDGSGGGAASASGGGGPLDSRETQFFRPGLGDPSGIETLRVPGIGEFRLETGPTILRKFYDAHAIAAASVEGIGYLGHNEDRFAVMTSPEDLRSRLLVIDGMGGHGGGERAAEIAKVVTTKCLSEGMPIEEALRTANTVIFNDNQTRRMARKPGAVAIAAEIVPLGGNCFRAGWTVAGDAEGVILRPGSQGYEVFKYTARPVAGMAKGSDDLAPRGQTVFRHAHPFAHITEDALGLKSEIRLFHDEARLRTGDIVILGSDGPFENFSLDEIAGLATVAARRGLLSARRLRGLFLMKTLIRMALCQIRFVDRVPEGTPMTITHEHYERAWRLATDILGRPTEPPSGWKGTYEGFLLTDNGNVFKANATKEEMTALLPKPAAHFKRDNATLVVHIVGEPILPPRET